MESKISSKAESVQLIYSGYLNHKYIVNRKYQRKLVWTTNEKKYFIDSLMNQFSVPLFLFAEDASETPEHYEIIDGLQRLNAICAFIENEFPVEFEGSDCYFDLDTLADTLQLKDQKKIIQRTPVLKRDICVKIVNYQLPISVIKADQKSIETVFRRINSYGRRLSEQEIRLAGAVGQFPDLIRKIASSIRGDVSLNDRPLLNDMQKISLTDRKSKYGIWIDDIFWTKNNIITKDNLRVSRDEELISHIVGYIIEGDSYDPSRNHLDKLYQYSNRDPYYAKICDCISKIGFDNIVNNVLNTHDIIQNVAIHAKQPLRRLICKDQKIHGLFRSYQILFLAIYDLYINDDLRKINFNKLANHLDGIALDEFKNIGKDDNWNSSYRNKKIKAIKGIISDSFARDDKRDVSRENWIQQLENILSLSKIEGSQYDFKQSCHNLSTGQFDKNLVKKMVKTLIAGCNNPNSTTYVIIGVADKEDAAKYHKKMYGSKYRPAIGGSFFITGIQDEVTKYHKGNFDNYSNKIKSAINECDVDDSVKLQILQNIKQVSYYGHEVIILKLESGMEPYLYDDKYYVRKGNNCEELNGGSAISALINQFNNLKP